MKVRDLQEQLSLLDQDTEIKIGHICNHGPNYNTEIYDNDGYPVILLDNSPSGGEEYLIQTYHH